MANVISFAIRFYAGKWLTDKAGNLEFTDFFQWWAGSQLAFGRNAAAVYDYSTFSAAQILATKSPPSVTYYNYVYPPTMLLLFGPIARLPYVAGFFTWVVGTLCLYALALYAIVPSSLSVVLALAPLPVGKSIYGGDATFLTAGLLGLALVFISRRPYLSGICLGILTYKPQFLVFFPIALVITGQWRVIVGATATASLLGGAATMVFGSDVWLLFLRSTRGHNPATLLSRNLDAMNQTVLGLMHQAGAGAIAAWSVHLAVTLLATAIAWQIWRRPVPDSLKAAAFSIGALIATPYMLAYDLTVLSVPAMFLVADALSRGFAPGERLVLLGCFMAMFLCFNFVIGPFVLIALMILVIRRVGHAMNSGAVITVVPQPGITS
ncbi:MAG: glycosyltransferase family 87 protein [Candidatus Binatus sp.]|uniref:glycosyltransferase family 87 protein n=1 Tax=Candidatus Binatus sp. TaxID=2811406 RepID=UPI003C7179F5